MNLNIILLILTGSVFAFISKDNLTPVSLRVAGQTFSGIPLFYVIMGSLLIGLVFSYLLQVLASISNSFVIRGKKKEIETGKMEILELTKRIHQLELENEKIKHDEPIVTDSNSL